MLRLVQELGIDLGTANILVFVRGKGVVLREPSVVAIEKHSKKVLAVGEEARLMLGRTPGNITAIRPMSDGVIADYTTTERMLAHLIAKVCGKRRAFKPRVLVCVPSGVTSVEKRAGSPSNSRMSRSGPRWWTGWSPCSATMARVRSPDVTMSS